jgi:hypothetical protein
MHSLENLSMSTEHFQNLIIGSGVVRVIVGGSCPNVACLPSKNVIYSAQAVSLVHPRWEPVR